MSDRLESFNFNNQNPSQWDILYRNSKSFVSSTNFWSRSEQIEALLKNNFNHEQAVAQHFDDYQNQLKKLEMQQRSLTKSMNSEKLNKEELMKKIKDLIKIRLEIQQLN